MNYTFEKLTADSSALIKQYSAMRPIYTSEGQFLNQFIWSDFYNTEYYVNDKFLFFKMNINNEIATMMPYCKIEDIEEAFFFMKEYFNKELNQPMKMYIVDELFLTTIKQSNRFLQEFNYEEDRTCFDYIYDAEKLKTLSGKSYHKKKNHLNAFLKAYEGRFEYRTLCCSYMEELKEFHQEWIDSKDELERQELIGSEENGVFRIFENCNKLDCKVGGVFIDGKLAAYSIGSYAPHLKCAFIHIEKGDIEYRGVYNFINQQFLLHEFPEAEIVNREDDLGQEGLRKAKLSYRPIKLEEKYNLFEIQ